VACTACSSTSSNKLVRRPRTGYTTPDVDAFAFLDDGLLLISLFKLGNLPGITTTLQDEDLLQFMPTSLGETTAGSCSLYFDGSDVGLADSTAEDLTAVWADGNGDLYLSTLGDFSVPDASGTGRDLFIFTPIQTGENTSGSYSFFWEGALHGWLNSIDGLQLSR